MNNLTINSIKKLSIFLTIAILFGCKKEEKHTFNFVISQNEVESRINMPGYFSITSGNGDYTIKVDDKDILDANFTQFINAPFGAITINGKKKGETTVFVTDNRIQSTREIKVKITDFYLPLVVSKSNHPALKKEIRIFLVNNDKKDVYFFMEEGDKYNLKQKGTYKFLTEMKEETKTPFLLLSYPSDENGKFTDAKQLPIVHKFDLSGSNSQFYDVVASSFGVNWDLSSSPTTKTSPIELVYLKMKEINTEFNLEAYIGSTSWLDYIPNGYLD